MYVYIKEPSNVLAATTKKVHELHIDSFLFFYI